MWALARLADGMAAGAILPQNTSPLFTSVLSAASAAPETKSIATGAAKARRNATHSLSENCTWVPPCAQDVSLIANRALAARP